MGSRGRALLAISLLGLAACGPAAARAPEAAGGPAFHLLVFSRTVPQ